MSDTGAKLFNAHGCIVPIKLLHTFVTVGIITVVKQVKCNPAVCCDNRFQGANIYGKAFYRQAINFITQLMGIFIFHFL